MIDSDRTMPAISNALDRLAEIFPPSRLLREAAQLGAYESDALTAFHSRPVAIVIPETQDEVIAAVRVCPANVRKTPRSSARACGFHHH